LELPPVKLILEEVGNTLVVNDRCRQILHCELKCGGVFSSADLNRKKN